MTILRTEQMGDHSSRPLLVVDGDSFAHRAYHGLPKSIRRRGNRGAGAIVGFANFLLRLYETERPRAVLVAWDTLDAPTYRHRAFAGYQSGRQFDPELLDQLALAVRLFGSAIERKQSEMAIRAARSELRVAARRNSMSELVASLSHEINQPLGAILSNLGGLARLLTQGNPEPAMALEAVNNAIEDTKLTAEIVRRIRSMFKNHVERKTAIGIGAVVDEVVKLTAGEAAIRRISVQTQVSPAVQRVIGDSIQLQQCVLNLVMNAFDAIAEAKSDRRDVTIKLAPEKPGWVGVSVCDNGKGIDRSVADRLFEPFVTTKSEGMGLGLLITRSIVENHGGRIWSTPNPDRGTTFTFTLPVAERKRAGTSRSAQ